MTVSDSPNVEELEVAPGFAREDLQGSVWQAASEAELREGLEKAFGYRGDVTLHLDNGTAVEGYIFDRRTGPTLAQSTIRLFPKDQPAKLALPYSCITGISFSGRDTAAGKSWEAWVKKYREKKLAGENNVELTPENLD